MILSYFQSDVTHSRDRASACHVTPRVMFFCPVLLKNPAKPRARPRGFQGELFQYFYYPRGRRRHSLQVRPWSMLRESVQSPTPHVLEVSSIDLPIDILPAIPIRSFEVDQLDYSLVGLRLQTFLDDSQDRTN